MGGSALTTEFSGKCNSIGLMRPAFHGRSDPKVPSMSAPIAPYVPDTDPFPIPTIAGSVPS